MIESGVRDLLALHLSVDLIDSVNAEELFIPTILDSVLPWRSVFDVHILCCTFN